MSSDEESKVRSRPKKRHISTRVLIQRYAEMRVERLALEKREAKYKKEIIQRINESDANTISEKSIKVTLSNRSREYISKACVPKNIWDQYKKKTHFDVLSVREKVN